MKKIGLVFLSLLIVTLSFSAVFADPSALIIVRGAGDSLWKATCNGIDCTGFTGFPGMFGSQPTVYWDENIQSWVLWGRASDSSIWRSTFDSDGIFQNDWVRIPGSTASPPGASGGGLVNNVYSEDPTVIITLGTTTTAITHQWIWCPFDGYVVATASGFTYFNHTGSMDYTTIGVVETALTEGDYTVAQVPSAAGAGLYAFPFSLTRTFSCPAGGGEKWVYVTGRAANAGNTNVDHVGLIMQYVPYMY